MDTLYHGMNIKLHNVLDVNAIRQDNGVVRVIIRHKVHNCTENTYGVAEFEMTLFPAEGGILYNNVRDAAKAA